MEIKAIKTKIFRENEDLIEFIFKYVKKIPENSVLLVTSKIVALSEGRTKEYKDEKQKARIIKQESNFSLKTKLVWMTVKDGIVMASSGVDESNAKGKLILLPKDSFKSAELLRTKLMQKFKLKNLGILITDSTFMPLRAGALGVSLGYAGFLGIKNYVGKRDIFGRKFKMTRSNIADSLATAAALCMGEGSERQPLAIIKDAPVVFVKKVKKSELIINPKEDIYAPLFNKLN